MAYKPMSFTEKQMHVITAASKEKTLLPEESKQAKAFVRMLEQTHIGDDLAKQLKKDPKLGKSSFRRSLLSMRYFHHRSKGRLVLVRTIKSPYLAQKVLDYNEVSSGKPHRKK